MENIKCNKCNSFIKNIPYQNEAIFYFGKYKGKKVSEIEDIDYIGVDGKLIDSVAVDTVNYVFAALTGDYQE